LFREEAAHIKLLSLVVKHSMFNNRCGKAKSWGH